LAKPSATEKLAMEICWKGFSLPGPHNGCRTKGTYWKRVDGAARAGYMQHAAELIWWTRKLGANRLAAAVAEHDAVK